MKILLSIKPEFVEEIFKGRKKFEYRRSIFKRDDVDGVVVYATKPVGLIVGEFCIEKILKEPPQSLWNMTSKESGITKSFFDEYFQGKEFGFALKIKSPVLYDIPIDPTLRDGGFVAPQSFKYVDDVIENELAVSY